ncbi:MAG TPA: hypothetical protein VKU85_16480 [bacterium]|nr:hypothetical protein [bacterium]
MRPSTLLRLAAPAITALAALTASNAPAFDDHVFVVTGDGFSPGNCAALDVTSPWSSSVNLEPVGTSPAVRHFLDLHWIVDRSPAGSIQVVDPSTFDTVLSFDVGGTPQDILVADAGSAWVTRSDSPWLLRVNPVTGAPLDSVDLGGFADSDGIPEMMTMERDGDRLFVQIQRVNFADQPPFLPGLLAVVDLSTRTVVDTDPGTPGVQAIALAGLWPQHKMQVDAAARRLYVSSPGPALDVSGGIEEINLDTLMRTGFLVAEATPSIDLGGFVLVSPTKGYVIGHTDIVASSHLSSFSRADGTLNNEAFTGLFYYLDTIAYDAATQQVFFPDPSGGGIRVFDALTDAQLTTVAVPTGLAPVDLVVARSAAVDAPLPAPGNNRLSVAAPNPTASATTIRLHRPAQQVRADILDVRGTVVRTLEGPPLRWDGRRADGRPAPAGVYFYRLRGDVEDRGRVVILR